MRREASVHPPIVLEQDGVCIRYWLEDGRVCSCEVGGLSASGDASGLVSVLERARAEFGALLPRAARDLDGAAPDLDAIERAVRDSSHGSGAAALKALLESLDARLPVPDCPNCGARMERHRWSAKRFATRLGEVEVVRSYCRCRDCGGGHHPLDRVLGIEGESFTPGAASIIADAVSDSSYEEASRKLGNLAGVNLHSSRLKRAALRIGEQVQCFERQEVDAAAVPAAGRMYLAVDGTGVPVRREEVEGVRGKGEDGRAKSREAKLIEIHTAEASSPGTGDPQKDAGSETVSCQVDSAAAVGGVSRRSEFAGRLEREAARAGLHRARELVVISDGAGWIRNVCEELFPGSNTTHILDFWHCADYGAFGGEGDASRRQAEAAGPAGVDQVGVECRTGGSGGRSDQAVFASGAGEGLHRLLREQQGQDALRPLPQPGHADWKRRRGECVPLHGGSADEADGKPLDGKGSKRHPGHQVLHQEHALGRLPRLEGSAGRHSMNQQIWTAPSRDRELWSGQF